MTHARTVAVAVTTGAVVAALDIITAIVAVVATGTSTDTNPLATLVPQAANITLTTYLLVLTTATVLFTAAAVTAATRQRAVIRRAGHVAIGVLVARAVVGAATLTYLAYWTSRA